MGVFQGCAEILSRMSDVTGRCTAHYTVPPSPDSPSQTEPYRICIGYNPRKHYFTVLQTLPSREYRNSFCVRKNGEIFAFCDHIPNKTFVEAIASEEGLPLRTPEAFQLKFMQGPDPIDAAKKLAQEIVAELQARGHPDKNLNPIEWLGPRRG